MKLLETERLYLREYEEEDLESLAEIYSDEQVMKYIGQGGIVNKEQVQKSILTWRNNLYPQWGFGIWAVIEKEKRKI